MAATVRMYGRTVVTKSDGRAIRGGGSSFSQEVLASHSQQRTRGGSSNQKQLNYSRSVISYQNEQR